MKNNDHSLTHYRPAMSFGNIKKIRGSIYFSIVALKKYRPSENLQFNDLGIFQSLKLRNLMGENPSNFS